jgi:hypothetical protein
MAARLLERPLVGAAVGVCAAGAGSISPEILQPVRRQRRVDGRAGDRPVAEPALDRTGVAPLVGERMAEAPARGGAGASTQGAAG